MKSKMPQKQTQKGNNLRASIPCKPKTREMLKEITNDANRDHVGYKIYPEDIIIELLSYWNDELKKKLQKEKKVQKLQ